MWTVFGYEEFKEESGILISWNKDITEDGKKLICHELYLKIHNDPSKVQSILKNYDYDIIIRMCRYHIFTETIQRLLKDILPTTDASIIFDMIKFEIPINIIESVADRININHLDKHNKTCLFYVTNMEYLLNLLSSKILNFDINHVNDNSLTFFTNILYAQSKLDSSIIVKMIKTLVKKGYNFNQNFYRQSILDILFLNDNQPNIDIITELISIKEYNPLSTIFWFDAFFRSFKEGSKRLLIMTFMERSDSESWLNRLMRCYIGSYATAEADILWIMSTIFTSINEQKLKEMVNYTNEYGDAVIHIASIYQLDSIIRFLKFKLDINSYEPNSAGQTPNYLYTQSFPLGML